MLKTDTVHRERGRCLSTRHWISGSHSQGCATAAGRGTSVPSASLSAGDRSLSTSRLRPSLQSSLGRSAVTPHCSSLPPNKGLQTHTGESPTQGAAQTPGLHINAQLGAFQEGQHTAAQNYNSPLLTRQVSARTPQTKN